MFKDMGTRIITIFLIIGCILNFNSCSTKSSIEEISVLYQEEINQDSTVEMGMIIDSLKHGLWVKISQKGILLESYYYVNGELSGPYKLNYQNGFPKFRCNMKEGEFDGERITYFSNGIIMDRGFFKEGKRDSIWIEYTEDGVLSRKVRYRNGEIAEVLIDNGYPPLPKMPSDKD